MRSAAVISVVCLLALHRSALAGEYVLHTVTNLTLVEVRVRGYSPPRYDIGRTSTLTITNATGLEKIAEFINARTNQWEIPWAGVPVPTVVARLRGATNLNLGHFGAGNDFFERHARGSWFSRRATRNEIEEFLRLVGMPLDAIDPTPRKPANQPVEATQPRSEVSHDQ